MSKFFSNLFTQQSSEKPNKFESRMHALMQKGSEIGDAQIDGSLLLDVKKHETLVALLPGNVDKLKVLEHIYRLYESSMGLHGGKLDRIMLVSDNPEPYSFGVRLDIKHSLLLVIAIKGVIKVGQVNLLLEKELDSLISGEPPLAL